MMLLFATANICLVFMLPLLAWAGRHGAPGVKQFTGACALCIVAYTIPLLGESSTAMLSSVAVHGLIIAACLCIQAGFRRILNGKAPAAAILVTVLTGIMLCLGLAALLPEADTLVALTAGCGVIAILLYAAFDIARYGARRRTLAPHLLFCGLACLTAAALQIPALAAFALASDGLARVTLTTARTFSIPVLFLSILFLQQGWVISHLRRKISLDDLTSVLSRHAFMDQYARLSKSDPAASQTMALLLLDLDHFKRINDCFGHAGGDAALRHFAVVIRRALPETAVFGRLGGEEFGIILPRTDAREACEIADRLCALVRMSPALSPLSKPIRMTVSIGVATDTADLMHRADMALYAAKSAGRDRFEIAPGTGMPTPDTLAETATKMRDALQCNVPSASVSHG